MGFPSWSFRSYYYFASPSLAFRLYLPLIHLIYCFLSLFLFFPDRISYSSIFSTMTGFFGLTRGIYWFSLSLGLLICSLLSLMIYEPWLCSCFRLKFEDYGKASWQKPQAQRPCLKRGEYCHGIYNITLVETKIYWLRLRYIIWDRDTVSKTKIHYLRLTNYYCLCNFIAYIVSSLASYFLQQSTFSLSRIFSTYLSFTSSFLLYYLYCWSPYPYRLHVSALHLSTISASTFTLHGFWLLPLCYKHMQFHAAAETNWISFTSFIKLVKKISAHHMRNLHWQRDTLIVLQITSKSFIVMITEMAYSPLLKISSLMLAYNNKLACHRHYITVIPKDFYLLHDLLYYIHPGHAITRLTDKSLQSLIQVNKANQQQKQ